LLAIYPPVPLHHIGIVATGFPVEFVAGLAGYSVGDNVGENQNALRAIAQIGCPGKQSAQSASINKSIRRGFEQFCYLDSCILAQMFLFDNRDAKRPGSGLSPRLKPGACGRVGFGQVDNGSFHRLVFLKAIHPSL